MNKLLTHKACRTHCCIIHGCKYGYDDCPVVIGLVKQAYFCESCDYVLANSDKKWSHITKLYIKEHRKLKIDEIKEKFK